MKHYTEKVWIFFYSRRVFDRTMKVCLPSSHSGSIKQVKTFSICRFFVPRTGNKEKSKMERTFCFLGISDRESLHCLIWQCIWGRRRMLPVAVVGIRKGLGGGGDGGIGLVKCLEWQGRDHPFGWCLQFFHHPHPNVPIGHFLFSLHKFLWCDHHHHYTHPHTHNKRKQKKEAFPFICSGKWEMSPLPASAIGKTRYANPVYLGNYFTYSAN